MEARKNIGYIYDDGGRADAGFKGMAGDCVTRALAILVEHPYGKTYDALAEANANSTVGSRRKVARRGERTARRGIYRNDYTPVFERYGLTKVKLPSGIRPTWSEAYEEYGDCIVTTAKHMAAIVNGSLHDVWDGRTYWFANSEPEPPKDGVFNEKTGKWEWELKVAGTELRERKAMSVWVRICLVRKRSGDWCGRPVRGVGERVCGGCKGGWEEAQERGVTPVRKVSALAYIEGRRVTSVR